MLVLTGLSAVSVATETTTGNSTVATLSPPSPALVEFVRTVIAANPRVQAARSAVNASGALQSAAARPLYNPELELEAEDADADTYTLGISQTIDWADKRSARSAVAAADRLTAEAEYLVTRRTVIAELLTGLAAWQTGAERHTLAAVRVRLMQQFAALAKRRFDAGDMPQAELDLATLVLADTRMRRSVTEAELVIARQQVNNLAPSNAGEQWPKLDARLPSLPVQGDTQSLLMALPEVQAAQRRVASANALVALRKREKSVDPTVSLTGGEEDGERLLGLNLSIPLPVRNNFSHEVTAAYDRYTQAQQLADDVFRRARARLMSAAERYRIVHGAWQDWQQIRQPGLQQQGDQLRRLWEAGELSTADFLTQISQVIDSRDSALDLRETLWYAWFEWLAASGKVDQWLGADSLTSTGAARLIRDDG
ncbi:MAG: TolC family protein [Gammaproteobacteria bacterium]|nr:TolC family protein [Gammaproteobacteria bacterium]MDE0286763.1 TolC family protein [Gammaproteobacteria bacterium]MDE0512392.1 TolC family protein [Gammaproteobacteria bacterium]